MRGPRTLVLIAAAGLCVANDAVASNEVVFGYGPTTNVINGGGANSLVAGMTFGTGPTTTATFNSLGLIDVGQDGLAGSYQLGIWDASQTLLASTTVTPSSTLIGDFRYASIPQVVIGPNQQFTIGVLMPPSPADSWLQVQYVIPNAGYTGGGAGQFAVSPTLVFPGTVDTAPYAVVNASDAVVPEPATMGLLGVGAATGLFVRRRRVERRGR